MLRMNITDDQKCTWCHRTGIMEVFQVWLATPGKLGYILGWRRTTYTLSDPKAAHAARAWEESYAVLSASGSTWTFIDYVHVCCPLIAYSISSRIMETKAHLAIATMPKISTSRAEAGINYTSTVHIYTRLLLTSAVVIQ